MTWARLDDNYHAHPTTLMVGLEANGLFCRALSYCAHYLTDGFVPAAWADAQGSKRAIGKLIDAGLWGRIEDGFVVVGYLERNPSRVKVEAERARERDKKSGRRLPDSPGDSPGEEAGDSPNGSRANG